MLLKNRKKVKLTSEYFPKHVAIIMDGNGRWAENRGKLRIFGHQAGVKAVCCAINFSVNHHLNVLTLYAFSSENWNRPNKEVSSLMELFLYVLENKIKNLQKQNIKLNIIGNMSTFSSKLQERISYSEKLTDKNNGLILNIAANYGGRWDIVQGVKKLTTEVYNGFLHPDQIDENTLCQYISMYGLDPVDLVIRTGGEHRISNFILWQIAYAELFFTDVLWPDFNNSVFENAIDSFIQRKRRFGRIKSENVNF